MVFFILAFMYLYGGRPLLASIITLSAMAFLSLQFVYQFKALNGILGGLFLLASLYTSLAVWSEFTEFDVITLSAKQLLLVGFGGSFMGILLSGFMIWSFIRDFE